MRKNLKTYMLKPLIYKIITRISIGLAIALLWSRFINTNKSFSIIKDSFFFLGVYFLGMAWFNYLKLDGFKISLPKKKSKSKNNINFNIFFREEKLESVDVLEEDEETLLALISNLLIGVFFILFSIIGIIII